MKNLIKTSLVFIAGGVIGGLVTYKVVRDKEEKRAEEDIESIRQYYNEKLEEVKKEYEKKLPTEEEEVSIQKIREGLQTLKEETERVKEYNKKEEETKAVPKYTIIKPTESWERDYPTLTLIYYQGDKILTDASNKEIINVSDLVPEDFAEHFGEYEEDTVWVRNDDLQVYYEIIKDLDCFSEN